MVNASARYRKLVGSNKIAVFLPGFLLSPDSAMFKLMTLYLSLLGYATATLDACGLWLSNGQDKYYSMELYKAEIHALLLNMLGQYPEAKKIVLIGHGLGGYMALEVAKLETFVTHVCLINAPVELFRLARKDGWLAGTPRVCVRDVPRSQLKLWGKKRRFVMPVRLANQMLSYNLVKDITNVRAKVFFIVGDNDNSVLSEDTVRFAIKFKLPYVVINANHMLDNNMGKILMVANLVRKFLESQ